jgi:hypothetical protein
VLFNIIDVKTNSLSHKEVTNSGYNILAVIHKKEGIIAIVRYNNHAIILHHIATFALLADIIL